MQSPALHTHRRSLPVLILLAFIAAGTASARSIAEPPSEIAKRVMPSVVLVTTENDHGEALARGSGFVVAEGVIATNLHVIRGASKAYAKVVNGETQLDVLGIVAENKEWDLVLLAVKDLKAPPLPIGDSAALQIGEDVYAVGNPHGLEGTFSAGIVSSIRRIEGDALLQITAPISPGSSGGPIVNRDAEVVGIAVASLMEGQNLNFAISSSYLRPMVKEGGDPQPLLGTEAEPAEPDESNDEESAPDTDLSQFVEWMSARAQEGDAGAMVSLGAMYAFGRGIPQDDREALKWFRKAADLGQPVAMYSLGMMYRIGHGVEKDQSEALRWYRKAADLGLAVAMLNLGEMYANGQGVAQDDREAVKWYHKAADQGEVSAMASLGAAYKMGRGVEKDDNAALNWFRKAADLGNCDAAFVVGWAYANGEGVAEDDRMAVKWYRQAANGGVTKAMYNLAFMYAKGEGVIQDHVEAYAWFSVASTLGLTEAREPRDIAATLLSAEARLIAQARAKERYDRIEKTLNR